MSEEKKATAVEKEPKFKLFRRTRGGVALTKEEVKEIKAGRKKLRKDMKDAKCYTKYEFEVTASSLGLYFDKRRLLPFWLRGCGMWALLGAALLLLLVLFAMALITQMRGLFTINLTDGMFREGFVLSETEDFAQPQTNLFAEPAVDVPCISITSIPADIDDHEGQHNGLGYFAYTYWVRNEGDNTVDYTWELQIVGESLECSTAAWVMVVEDGELLLFAEANADGTPQSVPAIGDESRGYTEIPALSLAADPGRFMKEIKTVGQRTYHRVEPIPFEDGNTVYRGYQSEVAPMDAHKYTVVVWLEGDDPDCTDDLIGGHLGLNMQYALVEEAEEEPGFWEELWDNLTFWDN